MQGWGLAICGASLLWVSWLSARGQLKRNGAVGIRSGATMASDAAWMAGHRASAWAMAVGSTVVLGAGVYLLVKKPERGRASLVTLSAILVLVVFVAIGVVLANRAALATRP